MTNGGVWVFSTTNRLAMFKAWEPKAKLLRSSWNWNLVKPNLSSFGIPLCKISRTALTLGWSNFIWWQTSECPEGLARSNWKTEFISLRELHILWLGWSQIAESTDTWRWQSAPCLVAYPIVSVATRELPESVWVAVSTAPKGILLLSQWHRVRMLQPSLATCHPVQCSPNMRVADCSTVWVGKCLQLIYRGALHLTLFEIYIRNCSSSQSNKLVSSNPGHAWPCLCLCPYVARNQGRHPHKSVRVIRTLHESARIIANPHLSGKEQCWNGDRVWAPSWSVQTAPAKADDFACEHNSWRDMGCLKGKPVVHFQSTKAKYKDHSQGDVFETSSCARTRQETCMFCSQETRCLMWWQPPNVQNIWPERTEQLRSSHWWTCTFCDLDGRKLLYQLTLDCGKVRRAKWPIPSSLLQQQSCQNLQPKLMTLPPSQIQRPLARGCVWNLKLCPHEARNLHVLFSRNSMPYVMATLRMSRRSGQIELKSWIHLTEGIAHFVTWMVANCWINWHLTAAKRAAPGGLSHRLCCNKRAARICVGGCFNCTKGDPSLVAVTPRSHVAAITGNLSSSTM